MVITGITHKCNFNCLFCLDRQHEERADLSFNEIKDLFQKIKGRNEDTIMLMTGESLIRHDFFEILKEAKKCNLKVKVTTNGSMLSYYDFLIKIIEGGVTQINFSLHSHIPKIANALSRNNRCHRLQQKALMNIDSFNSTQKETKKKISLNFNTVVNKLNYKHLDDLVSYLKNLLTHTLFRVKFKFMDLGGNDINFYKKMLPSLEEIKPYVLKVLHSVCKKKSEEKIACFGFPLCTIPSYEWSSVELQENLCHNNLYFDYHKSKDIKNQYDLMKKDFFKYEECRNCSLYKICLGVSVDYLKVYPNFDFSLSKRSPEQVLDVLKQRVSRGLG